MTAFPAMDNDAIRRFSWALGLSAAAHALLVVMIQAQPGGSSALSGGSIVEARIERAAPERIDGDKPADSPGAAKSDQPPVKSAEEVRSDAVAARDPARAAAKATDAGGGAAPKKAASGPGIEMPVVRDPTYYAVAALDMPPRLLGSADVCYPQGAIGEVSYVLMIDENGVVDRVSISDVAPNGLFTGAAVELCGRLKFTPGMKDGRAVRSRVKFVVGTKPS